MCFLRSWLRSIKGALVPIHAYHQILFFFFGGRDVSKTTVFDTRRLRFPEIMPRSATTQTRPTAKRSRTRSATGSSMTSALKPNEGDYRRGGNVDNAIQTRRVGRPLVPLAAVTTDEIKQWPY